MNASSTESMFWQVLNAAASFVAAVTLAITFVAAGFAACAVPDAPTRLLSQAFSPDAQSPFTKAELVDAAVATKDYTVGSHDLAAVYGAVLDINKQAAADGRAGKGAPNVAALADESPSADHMAAVFAQADETYVLTPDAMSHLDDVFNVVATARAWLIGIAVLAVAACAHVGIRMGRHALGCVMVAAGSAVIAVFVLLALWVAVDFNGFFAAFHSLFFTSGTWTFSYDSLLITMYPPEFWMGMGAVWLATTVLLSILAIIVGVLLRRRVVREHAVLKQS